MTPARGWFWNLPPRLRWVLVVVGVALVIAAALAIRLSNPDSPERSACRAFPAASTSGSAVDRAEAVYRLNQSVESEPLQSDLAESTAAWQDAADGRPDLVAIQATDERVVADCRRYS